MPRILPILILALALATPAVAAWDSMQFDLPSGVKESVWRDAFAERVGGKTEVRIQAGRIDVATEAKVFELDWPHKWKEGMGQALAYAGETGKKPVLVLISYSQGPKNLQARSQARFDQAEQECARHGVRMIVLFPSKPETPPKPDKPSAL